MTTKQLEDYLWGAANILRGMIDAADFKQYIFPLLFFKRISDVWDEEYKEALELSGGDLDYAQFRENHRFQIPDGCHWDDIRKVTVDVGKKLQKNGNNHRRQAEDSGRKRQSAGFYHRPYCAASSGSGIQLPTSYGFPAKIGLLPGQKPGPTRRHNG